MSNFKTKFKSIDEEVPRTAPKQNVFTFQSPMAPVVPEVSMVLTDQKRPDFYKWYTAKQIPATSSIQTPLDIKSYRQSAKIHQHTVTSNLNNPIIEDVFPTSPTELKIPTPNFLNFTFPPPPTPSELAILVKQKISESIAEQLKLHENQILELKELIKKLSREFVQLKVFVFGQREKPREMLIKPQVYQSIGIQCKLHEEINLDDITHKKSEPQLEISQKTGSIPKIKAAKKPCAEKSSQTICLLNELKLESELEKYEVLSGLPRSRLDEAMEIMTLTCKYIPREKLREWGLNEPGNTDVSISTLRYMEKYGLIGSIPEEKDKTAYSSQASTSKILDSEAIKNQPKFM